MEENVRFTLKTGFPVTPSAVALSARLDLTLPVHIAQMFLCIVLAEYAADSLHKIAKLALVTPAFGHQIGHLAAKFLAGAVGIFKLSTAYMCAQGGKKHGNEGFAHVF